jgi:hypothetical protein
MDETKAPESVYSGERTSVTGSESLRGKKAVAIAEGKEARPAPASPAQKPVTTTNEAKANLGAESAVPPRAAASPLLNDFVAFLQKTWLAWAIVAGTIFGGMALMTIQKGMAERARIAKEARQESAVATVTVDTLLTRCGPAAEDVTKEMYPMISRTMTYQPRDNERVVFQFSRTAEEKSDWVFLSMKDGSGTKSYDTTQAKIAALPCMDLKK